MNQSIEAINSNSNSNSNSKGIEGESSELPTTGDEAWSWCGDAMDYDLALFAMASHVRHGLQDDRQSG